MRKLPSWLDAEREILAPEATPRPRSARVQAREDAAALREQDAILARLGIPEWQRDHLLTIAAHESAWFRSALRKVHNLAGQKAKRDVADWHRRRCGYGQGWVELEGHTASGDAKRVLYGAFPDDETFWRMALERNFGPSATVAPWFEDYREAWRRLWASDPDWLAALIAGGYRGNDVARDPERVAKVLAKHHGTVARVRALLGRAA
jgi:hypothetical protein